MNFVLQMLHSRISRIKKAISKICQKITFPAGFPILPRPYRYCLGITGNARFPILPATYKADPSLRIAEIQRSG